MKLPRNGTWNTKMIAASDSIPSRKYGTSLPSSKFAAGHGGAEQRFHRAALPFARDHQRGQQRADQRHDQRQRAGQQEVAALQLRVVPDAGFGVGRRRERSAGQRLMLAEPGRPDSLRIVLHEIGGVGLAAGAFPRTGAE